jgi:hypothetical protein
MGYYTRYTLVLPGCTTENAMHEEQISEEFGTCFDDMIKWYDHKKDMIAYSKKYPDTLFMTEGSGEEQGDVWQFYFKNGKFFKDVPEVIWTEFDESLLEDESEE